MKYDSVLVGPADRLFWRPEESVQRLEGLPDSDRDPTEARRGVNVVHAPLYYVAG